VLLDGHAAVGGTFAPRYLWMRIAWIRVVSTQPLVSINVANVATSVGSMVVGSAM
jgi:hypothetical protein